MTVDFNTAYPKELTNAAWQKQKSFKDKTKAATKTGLGAELVKAEAAWKDIAFQTLQAKNFTPKSWDEANRNLENAQFVVNLKVKKAIQVIKATHKAAGATAKNTALSAKAQAAAKAIESKLALQRDLLTTINVNDFKVAITKVEAASKGGRALQSVTIQAAGGGEIGRGAKGIRNSDGSVSVYEVKWDSDAGDPKKLIKSRVTIRSRYDDDSVYLNDMTFVTLSSTGKTATFK